MSTAVKSNLPILSNEGGLSAYLEQIKKFPMLDAEEEYMLAKNWKTTGNIKSAEKLVKLSRDVHFLNDKRASIKLEINDKTGSKIREVKEYTKY